MIPNEIFFCFGFAPEPQEFLFVHYLAVVSAAVVNNTRPTVYYGTEPTGPWWHLAKMRADCLKVDPPKEIFGKPLVHYAHQADVFRLEKLIAKGGIYLDIDTLCLRPFTLLLGESLVMGKQMNSGTISGLCNAVMLAHPRSEFLISWHERYKTFRSRGRTRYWDEHSVKIPYKMFLENQLVNHGAISVVPSDCFFYPDFNRTELLFDSAAVENFERSYCVHLWEQMCFPRLKAITPVTVENANNAYSILARSVLRKND